MQSHDALELFKANGRCPTTWQRPRGLCFQLKRKDGSSYYFWKEKPCKCGRCRQIRSIALSQAAMTIAYSDRAATPWPMPKKEVQGVPRLGQSKGMRSHGFAEGIELDESTVLAMQERARLGREARAAREANPNG